MLELELRNNIKYLVRFAILAKH